MLLRLIAFAVLFLSIPGFRVLASVDVQGDRVSVKANSIPLVDVLRELAQKAGIAMVIKGRAGQMVTAEFDSLALDEALTSLLRGNPGSALVYEEASGEKSRLLKAYVILQGDGSPVEETFGNNVRSGAVEQREQIPIAVAEKYLSEGSPEEFIQSLGTLYPKQTPMEGLYSALRHPDPSVRVNALSLLAEMGSGERAKLALQDAANDTDPTVSGVARRMLGLPLPKSEKPRAAAVRR